MLISSEVPQQLNVNLGDYIQVQFERNYNVNHMLAHVVGIYQAMPGAYYAPTFLQFQTIPGIMMDLNDAIKAFGMNAGPESYIDQIYIRIQPNANPDVVAQAISQYFGVNVQYLQINVAADIINAYQGNARTLPKSL